MKQTSPLVITISRQLGSGGAYIGQQLAKTLNILYADREIISQVAKQFSVLEKDLESVDEKTGSFWQTLIQSYGFGTLDAFVPPQVTLPTNRAVFQAETEVIKRIAKEYSAVIIGRCGSHILRDHPNHVCIFLHSDLAFRTGRIQRLYNLSETVAKDMVIQSDKERSLYYHTFTGEQWVDSRQYNISIDTSKLGLDRSTGIIMNYLECFK